MGKVRRTLSEYYFYFIFAIWFGTEILFNTTIKKIFDYSLTELNDGMAILVLIFLVIQIVFVQDYSINEVLKISLLSLIFALATVRSNHKTFISMWLFVIAAKYVDLDKVAKIAYGLLTTIIVAVLWMVDQGYIEDVTINRGETLRHSLGFSHPNQLGLRIFQLALCRLFIRRNKLNWIDYIITAILGLIVFFVPNSQASFYSTIILLFMIIIYQLTWDKFSWKELISKILLLVIVLTNVFSVVLSLINVRKYPILRNIDKVLSYRFSHCYRTYRYYGLSLLGTDVKSIVSKPVIGVYYHFWLDNAYMAILLRYGIIVYLLFSIIYCLTALKLKNQNQYFTLFIYALFSIYGIMEYNFFSLSHNMFLIALASLLYNRQIIADRAPRRKYIF